jgi:hypothetical protein
MALPTLAAPIVYGDFIGSTVDYVGVFENNVEGPASSTLPLFGRPTVLGPAPVFPAPCVTCAIPGNSLDFTPDGFSASASNGSSDITDSQLGFMVVAHPGVAIETVKLSEAGDTSLFGLGGADAFTSVTASGTININEVDGAGVVVDPLLFDLDFVLIPSNAGTDATWSISGDSTNGVSYFTLWEGSVVIDIEAYLNAENVDFDLGATKITVNLDNTLNAASQENASAVISKKDFGGVTFTVNEPGPGGEIPEPSTLVLVGLSLAGLFVGRRRG